MIKSITRFIASTTVAFFPQFSPAQEAFPFSNLPLSMGEPVESETQTRPQIGSPIGERPELSFGDLSRFDETPAVNLTVREPIFAFLDAADGTRNHPITLCADDDFYISGTMTMSAEISFINHQFDTIGSQGFEEHVERFRRSIHFAFQEVASNMGGQAIIDTFVNGAINQDPTEVQAIWANIARIKDEQMGRTVPTRDNIVVNFDLTISNADRSRCRRL